MIIPLSYSKIHYDYGLVVVKNGNTHEFAFIPNILDEARRYEFKNKKHIRRINAAGLKSRDGKFYPKKAIVRKNLPDNSEIYYNTETNNLSLFIDDRRVDMLKVSH